MYWCHKRTASWSAGPRNEVLVFVRRPAVALGGRKATLDESPKPELSAPGTRRRAFLTVGVAAIDGFAKGSNESEHDGQ